jgi:class 3 adenylate cyclase
MAETSDTPSETLREWARDDRVTLAIVFTDIVGSTALGRALGDEQMNGVRRAHFGYCEHCSPSIRGAKSRRSATA